LAGDRWPHPASHLNKVHPLGRHVAARELGHQAVGLSPPAGRAERRAFSHLLQGLGELHFDCGSCQLPRAQQRRRVKPFRRSDRRGVCRVQPVQVAAFNVCPCCVGRREGAAEHPSCCKGLSRAPRTALRPRYTPGRSSTEPHAASRSATAWGRSSTGTCCGRPMSDSPG